MRRRQPTPRAARPSGPPKPACWRGWRPSGAGAPSGRRRASQATGRTWCAGPFRWCGTSSPATGTLRFVRSRCPTAATPWMPPRCLSGWTRTRSWWCPPSGLPTPAPTSRWRPWPRRWTSCRQTPAWTSTSTWMGPVVPSLPRSAHPRCSSTSDCLGSSRSAPQGTSSGWRRWGSAGSSGGTARSCPRT